MGLSGWLGQAANLTAVALICLMFYQTNERLWEQNREDRKAYAEQIKESQTEHRAIREAVIKLTDSVEDVVREVKSLKEAKP